jgi:hypothetical protein
MSPRWRIRRLSALGDAEVRALGAVTIDCVEADASIGFMHPLSPERAEGFWRAVADGVARGERALLRADAARRGGYCGTTYCYRELSVFTARDPGVANNPSGGGL